MSVKPADITLADLNLEARYSTHLPKVKKLVKFFKDHKHYMGSPDQNVFTEGIFELNGVPKERKDILKSQRGKMGRDILKQIDVKNILGIV